MKGWVERYPPTARGGAIFEYRAFRVVPLQIDNAWLNRQGAEGWELVGTLPPSIGPEAVLIFKRHRAG